MRTKYDVVVVSSVLHLTLCWPRLSRLLPYLSHTFLNYSVPITSCNTFLNGNDLEARRVRFTGDLITNRSKPNFYNLYFVTCVPVRVFPSNIYWTPWLSRLPTPLLSLLFLEMTLLDVSWLTLAVTAGCLSAVALMHQYNSRLKVWLCTN